MKRLSVICVILLAGCSIEAKPEYYDWAIKICSDNGGLEYMEAFPYPMLPNAKCKNGAFFQGLQSNFKEASTK